MSQADRKKIDIKLKIKNQNNVPTIYTKFYYLDKEIEVTSNWSETISPMRREKYINFLFFFFFVKGNKFPLKFLRIHIKFDK